MSENKDLEREIDEKIMKRAEAFHKYERNKLISDLMSTDVCEIVSAKEINTDNGVKNKNIFKRVLKWLNL